MQQQGGQGGNCDHRQESHSFVAWEVFASVQTSSALPMRFSPSQSQPPVPAQDVKNFQMNAKNRYCYALRQQNHWLRHRIS
jgi:hypothetical protein